MEKPQTKIVNPALEEWMKEAYRNYDDDPEDFIVDEKGQRGWRNWCRLFFAVTAHLPADRPPDVELWKEPYREGRELFKKFGTAIILDGSKEGGFNELTKQGFVDAMEGILPPPENSSTQFFNATDNRDDYK